MDPRVSTLLPPAEQDSLLLEEGDWAGWGDGMVGVGEGGIRAVLLRFAKKISKSHFGN